MRRLFFFAVLAFATLSASCSSRVVLGDERFDQYLPLLEGQRVAIYSNPSGIVGDKVEGWCLKGGEEVTEAVAGIPFGQPSVNSSFSKS